MNTKTYKAYGIALGVLWGWVVGMVFVTTVLFPGALDSPEEPAPRTVTIGFPR